MAVRDKIKSGHCIFQTRPPKRGSKQASTYPSGLPSADSASLSHSSATRSHASLSSGLITFAACSRASSACLRYLAESCDMTTIMHETRLDHCPLPDLWAIFYHPVSFKGRNSPVRSWATSGDFKRSSLAQSRHWNLRPPILRSKNRMGLRHFGQGGGGGFLGTMLTLDQARAEPNSQSPVNAEDGAVMPNLRAVVSGLSVRTRTLNAIPGQTSQRWRPSPINLASSA
jgi:hypothetical protein